MGASPRETRPFFRTASIGNPLPKEFPAPHARLWSLASPDLSGMDRWLEAIRNLLLAIAIYRRFGFGVPPRNQNTPRKNPFNGSMIARGTREIAFRGSLAQLAAREKSFCEAIDAQAGRKNSFFGALAQH